MHTKNDTTALTAESLCESLWSTMKEVRAGEISSESANAVAAQAREILRTRRLQKDIMAQSGKPIPARLLNFVDPA